MLLKEILQKLDLGSSVAEYDAALTRELIASACLALDDKEGAARERAAALATFEVLGVTPETLRPQGAA